ncbi:ABC transporter permease subunit, partial [Escherichia coli]|nr:ABC transporter permease subunit [Escherichia coli]
PKTSIICSPMTSLKTSIKTITYLSDIGCLEIQGASLDGLNRLQIIFRITVPLAMSGLISVFVYCFMVAWNDYLFASIFLSSASNFTLPVGLNALFSTPDYIWGRMMAASLVTALPVVIMYALSERFIKSGLTAGGVKG